MEVAAARTPLCSSIARKSDIENTYEGCRLSNAEVVRPEGSTCFENRFLVSVHRTVELKQVVLDLRAGAAVTSLSQARTFGGLLVAVCTARPPSLLSCFPPWRPSDRCSNAHADFRVSSDLEEDRFKSIAKAHMRSSRISSRFPVTSSVAPASYSTIQYFCLGEYSHCICHCTASGPPRPLSSSRAPSPQGLHRSWRLRLCRFIFPWLGVHSLPAKASMAFMKVKIAAYCDTCLRLPRNGRNQNPSLLRFNSRALLCSVGKGLSKVLHIVACSRVIPESIL